VEAKVDQVNWGLDALKRALAKAKTLEAKKRLQGHLNNFKAVIASRATRQKRAAWKEQ
jgi:hypothetical protein